MMWNKREKELRQLINDSDHITEMKAAVIVDQEKVLVYEFAEKCYTHLEGYENNDYLKSVFDDLLKQYNIDKSL